MTKFKKSVFITGAALLIIGIVLIIFISPIAKYLIQKYDEKYTGREITLSRIYLNPFTGYIHISDLNIHEQNSDTVFFSTSAMSANFAMAKLFSGTYEISEFTLDHPTGIIIQNKNYFNFNDLIAKFSTSEGADTTSAPVHFNILNIKIIDGMFNYIEQVTPINYSIREFNSVAKRLLKIFI